VCAGAKAFLICFEGHRGEEGEVYREEALVRLTNHRGNPVIFPIEHIAELYGSTAEG